MPIMELSDFMGCINEEAVSVTGHLSAGIKDNKFSCSFISQSQYPGQKLDVIANSCWRSSCRKLFFNSSIVLSTPMLAIISYI